MRTSIPRTSRIYLGMLSAVSVLVILFLWESVRKPQAFFDFETSTPATLSKGHRREEHNREDIRKLEDVLVHNYTAWHRETVHNVKSGLVDPSKVRTLIFLGNNGTHGLGDRMRGIIFSYLMAITSERLLLVDWRYPFPLSDLFVPGRGSNFTYDPELFSSFSDSHKNDTSHEYVITEQFNPDLFTTATQSITFLSEPRPNFNAFLKLMKERNDLPAAHKMNETLRTLSTRVTASRMFPLILKAVFRPSPSFRKIISEPIGRHNRRTVSRIWKKGQLKRINTVRPYISVHVRAGYGVGEFQKRFNIESIGLSFNELADCIAEDAIELAKELDVPYPHTFYLATDTVAFRKVFRRAIERKQKKAKVMFGSWGVKDVREMRRGVSGDLRKYLFTFADLFLLSKAEGIVSGSSGFASLAVWMGGIKERKQFSISSCAERKRSRAPG